MVYEPVKMGRGISFKNEKPGTQWEGVYMGVLLKKDKNQKEFKIWQFQNDAGSFEIVGCGSMNFQMGGVPIGTQCRITYLGRDKTPNEYGVYPHMVKVETDKESTSGEEVKKETDIDF